MQNREMKFIGHKPILISALFCLWMSPSLYSQATVPVSISIGREKFPLYPKLLERRPEIPSPYTTENGVEIVLAIMKNGTHALIPVTVENGSPLLYSRRIRSLYGKDRQLEINSDDFPALAQTGLHAESELDGKEMITGFPVSLITSIGRPGQFSGAGFMAEDEDLITVLKCDNRLVQKLGLTHPQMARPLFHVWNIILKEIELGKWGRFWDNIPYLMYNGHKVILSAQGTKGWQISIFQDEIQGSHDITVRRELSGDEKTYLKNRYPRLTKRQMAEMETKLSQIHFSEMAPYYVMRYGFYEGHTAYRSDPIAIAWIFGLKTLEEIEKAFAGDLDGTLTRHFTKETFPK